jgi:hypothetical protein
MGGVQTADAGADDQVIFFGRAGLRSAGGLASAHRLYIITATVYIYR